MNTELTLFVCPSRAHMFHLPACSGGNDAIEPRAGGNSAHTQELPLFQDQLPPLDDSRPSHDDGRLPEGTK